MVCSKNCKSSSSECPRTQGDTNRSDFSFATLRKHGEKGICLLLRNRYCSIEFCQNFYMCIRRKGETFTVSNFVNIGRQLFKLLPKNCGNRSDLSARPVWMSGSKVQGQNAVITEHGCWRITAFPLHLQSSSFPHRFPVSQGYALMILG